MTDWQGELREKRREVILEAAAKIFARKGYQRATIKEIAEEAGIATGTIYLYFENKHMLLLSIFERLTDLMPQEFPDNITPDEERGFIRCVMDEQLRMLGEYRPFFHALASEVWTDPDLWEQFWSQFLVPVLNTLELFLQTAIDTGRAREFDVPIIARAIMGTVYLFAVTSNFSTSDYFSSPYREDLVRELTDFFLHGIRKPVVGTATPEG